MSKYLIENLFGIEGWSIAWYGVIIAVGMESYYSTDEQTKYGVVGIELSLLR